MKEELENKLKEMYPQLLGSLPYFECDNGWYNIINNMCYRIQQNFDREVKRNPELEQPQFVQIKEKFGGLRAYMGERDDYSAGVVDMAESMASCTCEKCGNPGKTRVIGGWWSTYCQPCTDEICERTGKTEEKDEED